MMTQLKTSLGYVAALAFCAAAISFSGSQLTVQSEAMAPNCSGLTCNTGSDCGSKCFCNGPLESCIVDE